MLVTFFSIIVEKIIFFRTISICKVIVMKLKNQKCYNFYKINENIRLNNTPYWLSFFTWYVCSGKKYSYLRKRLGNRVYASDEARCWAATKADELEASLEGDYPSFVRPILRSHVTGWLVSFYSWLFLISPISICKW